VSSLEGRLRSILLGSMLGDGRLVRRPNSTYYSERHEEEQLPYLKWKMEEWGSWVAVEPKLNVKVKEGRTYRSWRFHTKAHASLNEWQALFYERQDEGWKRLVPDIVEMVDDLALAVWYLDDGFCGWWPDLVFGADAGSRSVACSIFEKFGLRPRWHLAKVDPSGHETGTFHMERDDTAERFLEIVRPHVPSCMSWKIEGFGYASGRNNTIKRRLDRDLLRELASEGVPLCQMAERLGVGSSTVDRHLRKHGIEHPRLKGNPRHREAEP